MNTEFDTPRVDEITYEFRHLLPHRTQQVCLRAKGDKEALAVAYVLASGAPLEIWNGACFLGTVLRAT